MSATPEPDEAIKRAVDDVFVALRNQAAIPGVAQLGGGSHVNDHNTIVGALINLDERASELELRLGRANRMITALKWALVVLAIAIALMGISVVG